MFKLTPISSRNLLFPLRRMSTHPRDWKKLAPTPPPGTITFSGQSSLQRLPVPEFNSTLRKLRLSLKALAWDAAEYRASESKIDDFSRGLGPELQRRLEERRDEPGRDHWLEEWWDEGAYLTYRDPVMINVSYYCEYSTTWLLRVPWV